MRRHITIAIAFAALAIIAGCTGSPSADTTEPPTAAPIDINDADVTAEQPDVNLSIAYESRTTTKLPTEPATLADDGYRWVLVNMQVRNVGEQPHEVTSYQYTLESESGTHEPVQTKEQWALGYDDGTIGPDRSTRGWVVYHVPNDVDTATLTVRSATQQSFDVRFAYYPGLAGSLPE